ncbi:transcriptional regulator [Pseudohongiella nitratireducens]|jgi:DNA-binding MarR family transcriptional regulator|uniref:Transcriptional regulator n=1 Tax=Pseudohongiella nitratireducens TaxID=1768907 RepID=A0A917GSL5_9GAMM|nr:MarR family transcriptional regulator [Pseudohongiella nitratireducens]GGG55207.1 transcriptional regulator [Pseudohongiella nitratireducens]
MSNHKDSNDKLGFVIQDIARLMRWNFDRRAQNLELTRAQWGVLANLTRCPGAQQKTLADLLEVTPITLARHIDRLEQNGWVRREDDVEDRRAKRVYLTEKGQEILGELQSVGQEVRQQALTGINTEEEEQLLTLLLRLRQNLGTSSTDDS